MFKQGVGVGRALTKDVHRVPEESKKSPGKAQAIAVSRVLPAALPGAATGARRTLEIACHHLNYLWDVQKQPGIVTCYYTQLLPTGSLRRKRGMACTNGTCQSASGVEMGGVSDLGTLG